MLRAEKNGNLIWLGGAALALLAACVNPTSSSGNATDDAARRSSTSGNSAVGKTAICHIPPGNPANAHTIVVGDPAVAAHLAHGDKIGACDDPGKKCGGGKDSTHTDGGGTTSSGGV